MNWQLINNVPPPKSKLLLVAFEDEIHRRDACFAALVGDELYFADRPNDLIDCLKGCRSEELEYIRLNAIDYPVYWTLFVWP